MILNANSTDSYSTWMTGWLWLDDSDFGVSKLPNAAKMGEQPLMQTHQLKEYLRPATICLPGGSWFDVFCCNQNGMQRRFIGNPTKQLLGGVIFPETWKLRRKYHLLHTVTSWNKLIVVFFGPPPYVVPSIKHPQCHHEWFFKKTLPKWLVYGAGGCDLSTGSVSQGGRSWVAIWAGA